MIEGIGSILHPWPEEFAGTPEEIVHQVESYPAGMLALLGGVGWGAGNAHLHLHRNPLRSQ